MRNPRLLLYIALVLAVLNLIKREDAAPAMPLVQSKFSMCLNNVAPIQRPDGYKIPWQRRKDTA